MGISVFNQVGTSLLPNTDFQIASVLKQAFVNCFMKHLPDICGLEHVTDCLL